MAIINVTGPLVGDNLRSLLVCDDIVPGDAPSYQTCKQIYSYHPLGAKLAEAPIRLAQSKPRIITIPGSPEEDVRKAFLDQWKRDGADKHLFNLHRLKRIYGAAAMALLTVGKEPATEINYETLWRDEIAFNVFDPLNLAGSLTGDLDPNSPTFLKNRAIAVNGRGYHRSRSVIALNEEPIYLEWTSSAYGYVGRSVYQRTLYPLKSFIETMITDAMVARKAGVLVAMMKQAGSIIDQVMQTLFARKREIVKDSATDNVIGIGHEEKIESLNLQNVNGAMKESRNNILENIASGAGMPAIMVTQETFSAEFHEGSEDAKAVADYIETVRTDMDPSYEWMTEIVQRRAWNPEFYESIQAKFPEEYGDRSYNEAFYQWRNAFTAQWPSLLTEPESKLAEVEDVKLKAIISWVEVIKGDLDPENKALLIKWGADNMNSLKLLFDAPLQLNYEELAEYEPPQNEDKEPGMPRPFAAQDSAERPRTRLHAAA